jgi:hypothetical protein
MNLAEWIRHPDATHGEPSVQVKLNRLHMKYPFRWRSNQRFGFRLEWQYSLRGGIIRSRACRQVVTNPLFIDSGRTDFVPVGRTRASNTSRRCHSRFDDPCQHGLHDACNRSIRSGVNFASPITHEAGQLYYASRSSIA